jgi:Fur family peroxide stress response transcriptional regulator
MREFSKRPRQKTPYRRSKQRERILELLQSVNSHPTANWLYGKLRNEFPKLSMGTVYRNIGILIEQGRLNRITFGSTFDRLDANMKPHYHFLCENCDAIIDLDLPIDRNINGWISKGRGFVVRRHDLEFRGLCPKCAKKA